MTDKIMKVESLRYLEIGYEGDNLVRSVSIDCGYWTARFREINDCVVAITRPDNTTYFPKIDYDPDTSTIIWKITRTDTDLAGNGYYQLIGLGSNGEVVHSDWNPLVVHNNMPGLNDATNEPPEASKTWYEDVIDAANEVKSAVVHNPIIGENGNWYIWNNTTLDYVDSGVASARPSDVYFGTEAPPNNEPVWINPEGGVWEMPEEGVFGREPIVTITAEEDVRSFIITEDSNKAELALKAILVKLTIPIVETTTNGYIKCGQILGDEACAAYFASISSANAPRESTFVCYPLYGRWFALSLGAANEAGNTNTVANYPVRNMRVTTEEMPVLKHVTISLSSGSIPKGTTVKVWGVRANA